MEQDQLLAFLFAQKLLCNEQVLNGGFDIIDTSRRNQNYQIVCENGPSFFVKIGKDEDHQKTIAHEALLYQFLYSQPDLSFCCQYLTQFTGYFPGSHTLILRLLENAISLKTHFTDNGRVSKNWSIKIGKFLGKFHQLTLTDSQLPCFKAGITDRAPFGLTFDQPDRGVLHSSSQSAIQLVRIIQQSDCINKALMQMRNDWNVQCLVHGDLRWDNCLLASDLNNTHTKSLQIIDWELSFYGDPYWDVATVFAEHIGFWLQSAPITGEQSTDSYLQLARFPLESMKPSMRSFWKRYAQTRQLSNKEQTQGLLRAVRYTAARLIQTAFEWANNASVLTNHGIVMIQLAENILRNPHSASAQLLGIAIEHEWAS